MIFSIIITSYKEPESIKKAIATIVEANLGFLDKAEVIAVAPDNETQQAAQEAFNAFDLPQTSFKVLKDNGRGKPAALNLAVKQANGEILFLTDGDMYISDNAILEILPLFNNDEVGGVSGHPVSLDARSTMFGYFSHLFCEAANLQRLENPLHTPMSGYLYAIRNIPELFPLPEEIRAEDAFLSKKITSLGYKTAYAPYALAYVHFPKNLTDWINQKKRSLGGNIQLKKFTANLAQNSRMVANRSIWQDLSMFTFAFKFATTPQEFLYSLMLFPLRLYLWVIIYKSHILNQYKSGMWKRIESSKY